MFSKTISVEALVNERTRLQSPDFMDGPLSYYRVAIMKTLQGEKNFPYLEACNLVNAWKNLDYHTDLATSDLQDLYEIAVALPRPAHPNPDVTKKTFREIMRDS